MDKRAKIVLLIFLALYVISPVDFWPGITDDLIALVGAGIIGAAQTATTE